MRSRTNRLLELLPQSDLELLDFEHVELLKRDPIEEHLRRIEHVYFFERGMASILYKGIGDAKAEIALVGPEGCSGCSVILGVDRTPQAMTMQSEGSALRVTAGQLQEAMTKRPNLRTVLNHYVHTAIIQRDETALAAAKGTLAQRLARWLLMSQDRMRDEYVYLTHEVIAVMLSVRRAGVTTALGEFARRGLVHGDRAVIHILNRPALIEMARPFYGASEAEFDRLYPQAPAQQHAGQ